MRNRTTNNRGPGAAPPPAAPVPVAPPPGLNTIERVHVEQVRHDQTKCPKCSAWGCPANRGSYSTAIGRVRYRQCRSCEFVFQTVKPHDGGSERIIL